VQPASAQVYDYEDPGPITDEELLLGAEARFLEYDREEAALENPLRGEVWLADSGMVAKTRPCLVLSIPLLDEDRALIGIVPHTTQPRGTRFEINAPARFLKAGVFDVQGLQPVPLEKPQRRLGTLTAAQMQTSEDVVRQWLDL
jgi:mRNA interferase MazF